MAGFIVPYMCAGGSGGTGAKTGLRVCVQGGPGLGARTKAALKRSGASIEATGSLELDAAVLAVGAGGGDERERWVSTIRDLARKGSYPRMNVLVARTIAIPQLLDDVAREGLPRWVVLRPGALVAGGSAFERDRALVTEDLRCNGVVSREFVAEVVRDIVVQDVDVDEMFGKVLGVYDVDRMISFPRGVRNIYTP